MKILHFRRESSERSERLRNCLSRCPSTAAERFRAQALEPHGPGSHCGALPTCCTARPPAPPNRGGPCRFREGVVRSPPAAWRVEGPAANLSCSAGTFLFNCLRLCFSAPGSEPQCDLHLGFLVKRGPKRSQRSKCREMGFSL